MKLIRKAHRNSLCLWLLAIAVSLRALIAPGFMLETNGDGPLGLAIVLCDGLNGTVLSDATEDPHALHQHHGNMQTQDQASNGLEGATCGMWSTSSTFVQTIAFAADHLFPVGPDQYVITNTAVTSTLYRQQSQNPRAPPVSFII